MQLMQLTTVLVCLCSAVQQSVGYYYSPQQAGYYPNGYYYPSSNYYTAQRDCALGQITTLLLDLLTPKPYYPQQIYYNQQPQVLPQKPRQVAAPPPVVKEVPVIQQAPVEEVVQKVPGDENVGRAAPVILKPETVNPEPLVAEAVVSEPVSEEVVPIQPQLIEPPILTPIPTLAESSAVMQPPFSSLIEDENVGEATPVLLDSETVNPESLVAEAVVPEPIYEDAPIQPQLIEPPITPTTSTFAESSAVMQPPFSPLIEDENVGGAAPVLLKPEKPQRVPQRPQVVAPQPKVVQEVPVIQQAPVEEIVQPVIEEDEIVGEAAPVFLEPEPVVNDFPPESLIAEAVLPEPISENVPIQQQFIEPPILTIPTSAESSAVMQPPFVGGTAPVLLEPETVTPESLVAGAVVPEPISEVVPTQQQFVEPPISTKPPTKSEPNKQNRTKKSEPVKDRVVSDVTVDCDEVPLTSAETVIQPPPVPTAPVTYSIVCGTPVKIIGADGQAIAPGNGQVCVCPSVCTCQNSQNTAVVTS